MSHPYTSKAFSIGQALIGKAFLFVSDHNFMCSVRPSLSNEIQMVLNNHILFLFGSIELC